jgi:hypothetical protein
MRRDAKKNHKLLLVRGSRLSRCRGSAGIRGQRERMSGCRLSSKTRKGPVFLFILVFLKNIRIPE